MTKISIICLIITLSLSQVLAQDSLRKYTISTNLILDNPAQLLPSQYGVGLQIERYLSKNFSVGITTNYLQTGLLPSIANYNNHLIQTGIQRQTSEGGLRFAFHKAIKKFDFYAGAELSYFRTKTKYTPIYYSDITNINGYGGYGSGGFHSYMPPIFSPNYNYYKASGLVFRPFVGMRYYPIKNLGIQLEMAQTRGSMGLNVKF